MAPSTKKKLGEILYLLICSFLPCLSWLLRSRVRKSLRDLLITLYSIYLRNSAETMDLSLFQRVRNGSGTPQTPIPWVPGFIPGDKGAGARCLPLTSSRTDIKNEWSFTSTSPLRFIACTGPPLFSCLCDYCFSRLLASEVRQKLQSVLNHSRTYSYYHLQSSAIHCNF